MHSVIISICLQQVQLQGMANTVALEQKTQKEEILLLTSCESLHQVKRFFHIESYILICSCLYSTLKGKNSNLLVFSY